MDIKAFTRDPEAATAELGLDSASPRTRSLLQQAATIKADRAKLKDLKNDKASVARSFKAVEQGSDEHSELVAKMQTVSDAFKAQETSIKELEKELREAIDAIQREAVKSPPFYQVSAESCFESDYRIAELESCHLSDWFEFVAGQDNPPLYCLPAWPEVIGDAFGHDTRVWAALSAEDKIIGGVALTFLDSRLFGRFAVSMPYFNYGGVLSPYFDVAQALLKHLEDVCQTENLDHIEVRSMQAGLWPVESARKVSMVLSLPKDEVTLDEQLGAKVRAQSKKAEKYQPDISFGKLELLDDFYQVFAINMRDLGTPVYTKSLFKAILDHPSINATLAVVRAQGRPVSVSFLVGHNGMLEIPWASTIKAGNAMDTNMWMYRQILDFAVREGYEFFDFGRSTREASTYRFKKQWGAQPYDHHWYYLLPQGGSVPGLNPDNPKYKLLIAAWQRMPVWLTKIIGPPLIKNIP